MNPLTEHRVHLSGNPIKSQGEMLLCLLLIIVSLPTVPFLEVYWDGGGGGELDSWGKEEEERERPSHYAHSAHSLHGMRHIC